MKDSQRTKAQLIEELELLRQRIDKNSLAKARTVGKNRNLKYSEIRYRRLLKQHRMGY